MNFQLAEERKPESRSIHLMNIFGGHLQTSKLQHLRCPSTSTGDLGKDFKEELESSPA